MKRFIETLAAFVHGVLAAFHLLALLYNYKKGNRHQTAFHAFALAYEVWSVWEHMKELEKKEPE